MIYIYVLFVGNLFPALPMVVVHGSRLDIAVAIRWPLDRGVQFSQDAKMLQDFFCVWSWPRCIIPILGKTSLKVPIPILGIGFWTYSIAEDTPVFFKSMEQQRCYCTACCTLLLVFGNHTWIDWDINRYPFHDSKILKPMHSVSCGCVGGSNFQHIFCLSRYTQQSWWILRDAIPLRAELMLCIESHGVSRETT